MGLHLLFLKVYTTALRFESAVILMKFVEVNKTNRLAAPELKQCEKDIHVIAGF